MGRMWLWNVVAALSVASMATVVAADWGLSRAGAAAAPPPGMGAVRNSTRKTPMATRTNTSGRRWNLGGGSCRGLGALAVWAVAVSSCQCWH
ncbi:unnamed protein product [Urochloa humidicola]